MRFVVEVRPGSGDRVEGTVERAGAGQPMPFSGWLELLRLLEPDVAAAGPGDERRGEARDASTQGP